MAQVIITRIDALSRRLKRYFTGKPCKQGHVTERRVTDYACVECAAAREAVRPSRTRKRDPEYMRSWRDTHPKNLQAYAKKARNQPRSGTMRERQARYYAANRDACRALHAAYYALHREEIRARRAAWRVRTKTTAKAAMKNQQIVGG